MTVIRVFCSVSIDIQLLADALSQMPSAPFKVAPALLM